MIVLFVFLRNKCWRENFEATTW